ncbi:uncharacterized protein EKO05_0010885 [Ascochyta rabiei]|uniref:uncharacterized protein n=1 Tax=Didymella rabiei TaxID=5454 RepID=UPI001901172E|nr:uncharacterized protein EKO05_0010885 [Ascochyta rabiei]UPX20659.1 hypothetical protein EKO05_0010885 [Ascochyta rabiei]
MHNPSTHVCLTNASRHPLDPQKWLLLPTYRLRLTLFYTSRYRRPSQNTTTIRKFFASPEAANDAALQLAKDCRGEGEAIMLVARNEGDVDALNRYAVGTWDGKTAVAGRVPCKWSLMLDFERERLYSHDSGDVTAYVEVVRSWDTDVRRRGERVSLEELQSSGLEGKPPPGLGGAVLYRFGKYEMRDMRAWRRFVITTSLDRKEREKLEDLSALFADGTVAQRPIHAWYAQSISDTIAGLEENMQILQLAAARPRDAKIRFDFDTAPVESPAEIGWRLAKKSVVAKDIAMFNRRVEKLKSEEMRLDMEAESRPILERTKTFEEPKYELDYDCEFLAESRPALARYRTDQPPPTSARIGKQMDEEAEGVNLPLPDAMRAEEDDLPLPNAMRAIAEEEKLLPGLGDGASVSQVGYHNGLIRTSPNECKCNAHRWRRESFPSHKPLPSYEFSPPEQLEARLAAQLVNPPKWALDPTHMPRSRQPFIPERALYPEPTTLCGYIRRQLETTRPAPREAYVRFGVMDERDCETRWGSEWRLQCQNDQMEWDHERNVRKRWKRPSKPRLNDYPVSELDGYEGGLLEHEMS